MAKHPRSRRRPRLALALCLAASALACGRPAHVATGGSPAPAALNWNGEDLTHVTALRATGLSVTTPHAVLWAPRDSISLDSLRAVAQRVDAGIVALRRLIGGPYAWQRLGERPIDYYLVPSRVISHASGRGAVFISVWRVHTGVAPFLHEGLHELLEPTRPFMPWEYADSATQQRVAADQPLWFLEGLADHLAQLGAADAGVHEGDVFGAGDSRAVDQACANRLAKSPHRQAIIDAIGRPGRPRPLFTTERTEWAPIFYPCSRSLVKHLVATLGVPRTVALMPAMQRGEFEAAIEREAGRTLEAMREEWMAALRIGGAR